MTQHHNHYKEPWYWECHDRGINARVATADDVLGAPIESIQYRDDQGIKRKVLLASQLITSSDDEEGYIDPLELGRTLYGQSDVFVGSVVDETIVVVEVAGLTKTEAQVVGCIMDGVGTSYGYANRIADRLNISQRAVQSAWNQARKKLKSSWA
jgi:DNA-binding CsgD family transcriptional regulator